MKKWVYPLLYGIASGILLLHAASPLGLVSRILPISIELFTGIAFLFLSVHFWVIPSDKKFISLTHWYIPSAVMIVALGLRITELLTYSNFVFSHIHIDPSAFSLLSFLVSGLSVTTFGKTGLKERPDHAITLFGFWLLHIVLLGYYNYPFYNSLSGEDKVFEWITFVAYIIGAIVFLKIAKQLFSIKKKNLLVTFLFVYSLLGALGYIGIAGEEISWGQRILHFETPENYVDANSQGEFNLHNNELIFNKIYMIYGLICVYILLSPVFYKALKNTIKQPIPGTLLRAMTFRWYHGIYFIPTLIYVAYRLYYQTSAYDIWEEATEVLFAMGMLMYAVHVYWVVKKGILRER